jgi:SAM-dependent methyltransferase
MCPLCGAAGVPLRAIHYALFDDTHLPRHTMIERCGACRFVFANSDAVEADYVRHYQHNSIYAATGIRPGAGLSDSDRLRLEQAALRMSPHLGPEDLCIDIGAGGGGLLRIVGAMTGCLAMGLDPDPRCVEVMRAAGIDARVGTLDSLPDAFVGRAKIVALSHVLEHLWNPPQGIRQAMQLLAPDGLLYVETPNRAGYSRHPNVPFYYFDPEHINHFSPHDFRTLAQTADTHCVAQGEGQISLADGTPYPVCWALMGHGLDVLTNDGDCLPASEDIEAYIDQQEAVLGPWIARARERLAALGSPLLLWGTGSQAQRVLAEHLVDLDSVAAFIDSDPGKQARRFMGKPVMAPNKAFAMWPDAPVAVLAAHAAAAAIHSDAARRWPSRSLEILGVEMSAINHGPG